MDDKLRALHRVLRERIPDADGIRITGQRQFTGGASRETSRFDVEIELDTMLGEEPTVSNKNLVSLLICRTASSLNPGAW